MTSSVQLSRPLSPRTRSFVIVGRVLLAAIVVQFALAGIGAFSALHVKNPDDALWAPHVMLGYTIGLLTLVFVALAYLAPIGSRARWFALGSAGLAIIGQPLFSRLGDGVSYWFGLLHVLSAVAIAGLISMATVFARRT